MDTPMAAVNDFPMPFMVSPQDAARAVCDGFERERSEIVFPWRMAGTMKVARLLPVRAHAALWRRS